MNKWKKKIDILSFYYDQTWDEVVEYHEQLGTPLPCRRIFRRNGYIDGAERIHKEILHLIRSNKYKVDKMIREEKDEHKAPLILISSVLNHLIKELTQ